MKMGNPKIKVMSYDERENLKRTGNCDDIDRAHWHRFLESVNGPDVELPAPVRPSFSEYQIWKQQFIGWSYGPLRCGHSAWKDQFASIELPMNEYYKK